MIELTMEYVSMTLSGVLLVLLGRFLLSAYQRTFYAIQSLPTIIWSFYVIERKHWMVFLLLIFVPFFDLLWIVIGYSVVVIGLIYQLFCRSKEHPVVWNTKTLRVSFILLVVATIYGSAISYWINPKELVPVMILSMVALVLLFSLSVLILWPFEWTVQMIRLWFIKKKLVKQGVAMMVVLGSEKEPSVQDSINSLTAKATQQPGIFFMQKLIQFMEEFFVEFHETFGKDNRMLIVEMEFGRWRYARWFRFILQPDFVVLKDSASLAINAKKIEDMFKNEKTVYFKNELHFQKQDKRFKTIKQGWVFLPERKANKIPFKPIQMEKEATFYDWVIRDFLSKTST